MLIVLAGASGFIGSALRQSLHARGDTVRVLVRRPPAADGEYEWAPASGNIDQAALDGADAVVNLAGAPVATRWTSAGKRRILDSRVWSANTLARAIAATTNGPKVFVQASAIGYYGNGRPGALDETAAKGEGFLSHVVAACESATDAASRAGCRVAFARTGIVLDTHGGALSRLAPLIRLGLAGPLGNGRQWWSWITLADEVRALCHLIDADIEGPANLTAPRFARQIQVVRALAHEVHRPAFVPVPSWALQLAIGGFAQDILGSQKILPAVLNRSGFRFDHPTLKLAAPAVMGTSAGTGTTTATARGD